MLLVNWFCWLITLLDIVQIFGYFCFMQRKDSNILGNRKSSVIKQDEWKAYVTIKKLFIHLTSIRNPCLSLLQRNKQEMVTELL